MFHNVSKGVLLFLNAAGLREVAKGDPDFLLPVWIRTMLHPNVAAGLGRSEAVGAKKEKKLTLLRISIPGVVRSLKATHSPPLD